MSSFFTGRSGLALRDAGGRVGHNDLNQGVDAGLAFRRLVCDLAGGEGRYAGGAATLADLGGSGRTYPPVWLMLKDDGEQAWAYQTSSPTAIQFNVAAADTGRLYALPVLLAGVSPAAADGRLGQLTFVADSSTAPPPAHSLLLGSGTIAGGAFTTWSPAGPAPGTSLLAPKAHASTHQHGGGDEVATATAAANAIPKAGSAGTLDKAWLPTSLTADYTLAGSLILTNGRLRQVPDAKFGKPAAGAYSVGDRWLDAAGAVWVCTADGTPGTWLQTQPGVATTWSGGGSTDITAVTNWQGSVVADGYRVIDATAPEQMLYTRNAATSSWLGPEVSVPLAPYVGWVAGGYSATASNVLLLPLPDVHDLIVTRFSTVSVASGCDSANRWTIDLCNAAGGSGAPMASHAKNSATNFLYSTPTATVLTYSTHIYLAVNATKTGSPGTLTALSATLTYRYVRR